MFDGQQLGETIVGQVKGFLEREVAPLKAENVELKRRIAALEERPLPEKGDPGENGTNGIDGKDGRDGADGASITFDDVRPLISEAVAAAFAAVDLPKDGADGKDGRDGVDGKDGEPGKDAANIVEALKHEGELVLTLQDGRLIRTGVRDGEKGADGKDGLGFDDMDVAVLDDDRTIELSFRRGDEEKAFTLKWPTMVYRGIWAEGVTYQPGDVVTWGGSAHVAEKETSVKPETKDGGWRLAVKRGRDGKDFK